MFRLDTGKKHSRRRSVKLGNRQLQKAEAAFSLEVFMHIPDKHGYEIEWGQLILSWDRRRLLEFLPPLFSMSTPSLV